MLKNDLGEERTNLKPVDCGYWDLTAKEEEQQWMPLSLAFGRITKKKSDFE